MQIQQVPAPIASPEWLITLDCDAERRLTDDEIAKIAEHCIGTKWDDVAKRYFLDGRSFGPPIDGRPEVKRNEDSLAVTIHFDCSEVCAS